ncbi:hypothetical protein O1D97_11465 [Marinomonas sp. 15G1-11]|uniref:Uncharacterized protein n=1 Tax=Marinomonas phaeophyticola TaxID=3004091 RepID=A0ABT4JV69_9GAMM|nr:hypothetical protein [Marinomonas sp. 15G1-11]MCZ2722239.1 hypothetical protein [Marinomonas sp. 15G1-11]
MHLSFLIPYAIPVALAVSSLSLYAECRDLDSIKSSNEKALKLLPGEVFLPGRVLKKHHPSEIKEVASYIKSGDLYYTVFSHINAECKATLIKRTNGKH